MTYTIRNKQDLEEGKDDQIERSRMTKKRTDDIKLGYLDANITESKQSKNTEKSEISDSDDVSPKNGILIAKDSKPDESKENTE